MDVVRPLPSASSRELSASTSLRGGQAEQTDRDPGRPDPPAAGHTVRLRISLCRDRRPRGLERHATDRTVSTTYFAPAALHLG